MLSGLRSFARQWQDYRAFISLHETARRIVFYSEGASYWVHFEAIILSLVNDFGQTIIYLTSDASDPVLRTSIKGVHSFCIGDGSVRSWLFAGMQAEILVMTMPDLETFHIKRSPHCRRYVYVHHSMVSCHMVYRPEAFDHFDAVFCVGPHHVAEIRARERSAGLKPKQLLRHGYGRLEALTQAVFQSAKLQHNAATTVLIAPSWGEHALLERNGGDFIEPLLNENNRVILRPHPQTRRLRPKVMDAIVGRYKDRRNFVLDENMASMQSLHAADIMISDWSGAALEFAFAYQKPVLFVDVPRKVNNPDYESFGIVPLEVWIRDELGSVLPENRIMETALEVNRLLAEWPERSKKITALRQECIYNFGSSGRIGAQAIMEMLGASACGAEHATDSCNA